MIVLDGPALGKSREAKRFDNLQGGGNDHIVSWQQELLMSSMLKRLVEVPWSRGQPTYAHQ